MQEPRGWPRGRWFVQTNTYLSGFTSRHGTGQRRISLDMDLGLRGRVAAVAAGSKGLGKACAESLAHEGAAVSICARGEKTLHETAEGIADAGGAVRTTVGDISLASDCERFIRETVDEMGRLDVLVCSSGGPPLGAPLAFDDDAYRDAIEQNLLSVVRLTREAVPHMRIGGWGRIVIITSYAVKQPLDGLVLSNTARAGVAGFAKTLANELAREGITVNVVAPGPIRTDRILALARAAAAGDVDEQEALRALASPVPMGRVGRPEELAAVVTFLAGEPASFVTGITVQVDGGAVRSLL